ncbi:MAG: exodeoxyribonuclease VII large subunit [Firmicutes bacterium]|nr:exodeoxyribonuclease VII large subunit [Bacillota bacterium]
MKVFSVSQITRYLRALLDGDEVLAKVLIQGEISNFKHHSSGHMYFTLKDAKSCIRSVMFRSRASGLQFIPQDGMQVIAQGNISVYERDGQYQLYVNSMRPAGQGQLHLAFLELKEKLEREGLFAAAHKQALPFLPRVIGIATSPTGAALQDMLTVIRRRFPRAQILLAPVVVQGAEAPPSIVRALQYLGAVPEVDVIILGRGGGSIEELWAFNDERVARAIYACPKPVVSAVGHETDFTIADFVADLRAPTPSAAAEAVVPVLNELEAGLKALEQRLIGATYNLVLRKWQAAQALSARLALHHPERTISNLTQTLDSLETRMINAMNKQLTHASHQLQANASKLQALSPLAVLARGYSIVLNRQEEVIRAADAVQVGDQLEIVLAKGRIHSQVISTGGI